MPRYKMVGNTRIELTSDELAELTTRETEWTNSAFDRAIAEVRRKRNELLAETDFHGMSDNTMASDMTTYRQNLRDITNGVTTQSHIDAISWPTKP